MALKYLLPLLLLLLTACSEKTELPQGEPPVITWRMTAARFTCSQGEVLSIVPDVLNTDETSQWTWTMDGQVVSREDHCTFEASEAGEFFIQLLVTNRYGEARDEVKVTVQEKKEVLVDDVPPNDSVAAWYWPFTELNIPLGRSISLQPYMVENINAQSAQWFINGEATAEKGLALVFTGLEEGPVELTLQAKGTLPDSEGQPQTIQQSIHLNVCPQAGTYRRQASAGSSKLVNRVFEYQPAPGHQVNGYIVINSERLNFPRGCTHEQACDTVLSHLRQGLMISLGGCGGYLVAGFDHSQPVSKDGSYDLFIKGNPFSYQSEPGIVWVSQDVNGDGLPNDLWYELAGSEYGTDRETPGYALTYYRPSRPGSAVVWRDNDGQQDVIPYLSYWNPQPYYWQDWQSGQELTFCLSRLRSNYSYDHGISDIRPYPWGYADNLGETDMDPDDARRICFRLSNARTWDGQPANLEYIDFVKVQTAETGWTPNLGEISTEIYKIEGR